MNKAYLAILILFCHFTYASVFDYIYPYSRPSFSNYGSLGLIQMPSARFNSEGTLSFSWTHNDPYLRGSIVAYPFNWFEASFQYTDINNTLYSDVPEFSGSQSLKDKSFDAKFRVLSESYYYPAIALGFRDLGGTGLFAGEYIVASKFIKNFDFSIGVAWGSLSSKKYKNPFSYISNVFNSRTGFGDQDSKGGELTFTNYFRGDADLFFGVEAYLPYLSGKRLKIEYDTTDYLQEGPKPVKLDSRINIGIIWPISDFFSSKLSFTRGNTVSFGFDFSLDLKERNPLRVRRESKMKVDYPEIVKSITARNDSLFYRAMLKYLNDDGMYLQNASKDNNSVSLTYTQNSFRSFPHAAGRIIETLDQILPTEIQKFEITNLNATLPLHTIIVDREVYNQNKFDKNHEQLILRSIIKSPQDKVYLYNPAPKLPQLINQINPNARYQIGGPDGFFFGDLTLDLRSELIIFRNLTISSQISHSVFDNFADLKLASDSVLPHVRTDIVSYLKETSGKTSIQRLQFNYFNKLSNSVFAKISGGVLEEMFSGYGGEVIYRPFDKNYAVSLDAWQVKQRDYRMLFKSKDYETITGHLNLYYREPNSKILILFRGGKYLAKDSGITLDFSREFDSGLQMGIFFTKTDISSEEFGEGSFDKGFYFHIPLDLFISGREKKLGSWGLRPITRDGGQILSQHLHLWGVTSQGSYYQLKDNWIDIYD